METIGILIYYPHPYTLSIAYLFIQDIFVLYHIHIKKLNKQASIMICMS